MNSAGCRLCLGSLRLPIEEQGLADHRFDRIRTEWLGDQKSRLRGLAGEKALGKRGNEDDRDFLSSQNLVDGLEPGASIGKLNVGQNEPRTVLQRGAHRLGMGPGDRCDVVTQLLDKGLNVERDERFVLDDQNRRTNLFGDLAAGAVDQVGRLFLRAINDLRNLSGA